MARANPGPRPVPTHQGECAQRRVSDNGIVGSRSFYRRLGATVVCVCSNAPPLASSGDQLDPASSIGARAVGSTARGRCARWVTSLMRVYSLPTTFRRSARRCARKFFWCRPKRPILQRSVREVQTFRPCWPRRGTAPTNQTGVGREPAGPSTGRSAACRRVPITREIAQADGVPNQTE